mmetsp:Transcript_33734/g.100625  ORF Transcript_33734/g.100625 Transcript_33734/m.100625 type:complete len:409 (+) Transcript_33734:1092-2318(+)
MLEELEAVLAVGRVGADPVAAGREPVFAVPSRGNDDAPSQGGGLIRHAVGTDNPEVRKERGAQSPFAGEVPPVISPNPPPPHPMPREQFPRLGKVPIRVRDADRIDLEEQYVRRLLRPRPFRCRCRWFRSGIVRRRRRRRRPSPGQSLLGPPDEVLPPRYTCVVPQYLPGAIHHGHVRPLVVLVLRPALHPGPQLRRLRAARAPRIVTRRAQARPGRTDLLPQRRIVARRRGMLALWPSEPIVTVHVGVEGQEGGGWVRGGRAGPPGRGADLYPTPISADASGGFRLVQLLLSVVPSGTEPFDQVAVLLRCTGGPAGTSGARQRRINERHSSRQSSGSCRSISRRSLPSRREVQDRLVDIVVGGVPPTPPGVGPQRLPFLRPDDAPPVRREARQEHRLVVLPPSRRTL